MPGTGSGRHIILCPKAFLLVYLAFLAPTRISCKQRNRLFILLVISKLSKLSLFMLGLDALLFCDALA
jgi:hypothetical protein